MTLIQMEMKPVKKIPIPTTGKKSLRNLRNQKNLVMQMKWTLTVSQKMKKNSLILMKMRQ